MPVLSKEEKLEHCVGCHCDFYNGKNDYDIKKCWSLDTAKLVMKKQVHRDQVPPWTQDPIKLLDCYRRPPYIFVEPDREY